MFMTNDTRACELSNPTAAGRNARVSSISIIDPRKMPAKLENVSPGELPIILSEFMTARVLFRERASLYLNVEYISIFKYLI